MPDLEIYDAEQHSGSRVRGDDAGVHLARDLEHRIPEIFRKHRPTLSSFQHFSIDSSVAFGKKVITRRNQDEKGKAGWVGNEASDLNKVTIERDEEKSPYKRFGIALSISMEDMEAATASPEGVDLFAEDHMAMVRALEEFANDVNWKGEKKLKLYGLANLSGVAVTKTKKIVKDLTPNEWIELMNLSVTESFVESKGVHSPNKMLMGLEDYRHVSTTARNDTSDTTILQFFQMSNPGVNVGSAQEMDDLGDIGPAMATLNDDPMNIRGFLSPFHFLPVQIVMGGLKYVQVALCKTGGLLAFQPKAIILKRMRRS